MKGMDRFSLRARNTGAPSSTPLQNAVRQTPMASRIYAGNAGKQGTVRVSGGGYKSNRVRVAQVGAYQRQKMKG